MKATCLGLLFTFLLFTLVTGSYAQEPQNHKLTQEQRATLRMNNLDKKVALTDDQKPKATAIFLETIKQEDVNRSTANGDRAKFKEIDRPRKEALRASLKNLLTPEQLKTYEDDMRKK